MPKCLVTSAAFLVFFTYSSFASGQQIDPYCRPSMMWMDSWYGWFLGPVMMISFLAIAVAVVVLVFRWLGGVGPSRSVTDPAHMPRQAIDILKERFARGEINKDEFDEKRRVLEN